MNRSISTILLNMMTDPRVPAVTRLRAAEAVLDLTSEWIFLQEIEERIAMLERAATKGKEPSQASYPQLIDGFICAGSDQIRSGGVRFRCRRRMDFTGADRRMYRV